MRREFERRAIAAAVGAIAACWTGATLAAGFQLQEQNSSGLGNAFSGQAAAAEDASTIYWNPAGMTRLKGGNAVGSLFGIGPSVNFNNTGSTAPSLPAGLPGNTIPLGGNGGDGGGWAAVPTGFFSWETVPDKLWLGIGLSTPFGLTTEWDDNWVGRFHAVKSEVKTININPSIAWKANEMFSVGGGINLMYLSAELSNQVAYGLSAVGAAAPFGAGAIGGITAQLGPGGINREGLATVQGDDWAWGWNIGVMFNITPETRLGAHYRSKTKFTLAGDIQFQNAPTFATAGPLGALGTGLNANFANGNVQADIELPDTATIGLSHNFTPKLQVLFDYTWTGWSSIQYLSIYRQNDGSAVTSTPLQFNNSWRVGLGANYQLTDQWKLRLGVAYDTTPVQDQYRTPRLPDSDRTWLAIGAQYAMTKQLALDFGYAYLFAADANSNLPNLETDLPSGFRASPKGNLVGNYTANVNILTAGVRYSF